MQFRLFAPVAILALGMATTPLFAQRPEAAGRRGPGMMQARALEGITLTAEQQAKIDSITAKQRAERPMRTPGTPPSDAERAKMRERAMASLDAIRGVLTPEQQVTFQRNVREMRERMGRGMNERAPMGAPHAGEPSAKPATPAPPAPPSK